MIVQMVLASRLYNLVNWAKIDFRNEKLKPFCLIPQGIEPLFVM